MKIFNTVTTDKKKEIDKNLNCNLCRKKYNLTNKRPFCLIPWYISFF